MNMAADHSLAVEFAGMVDQIGFKVADEGDGRFDSLFDHCGQRARTPKITLSNALNHGNSE